MKILPIALMVMMTVPGITHAEDEEGTASAISHSASYMADITKDAAGNMAGAVADLSHAVAVPTKEKAKSIWGYLSDVGNGYEKSRAVSNGDGVAINASVYSLALRQAERENLPLKSLQKERDERLYNLKRAQKESARLVELTNDYKDDATKFQSNISTTLVGIAESAKKLEGWDKAHQEKLNAFISEHKKLGSLTATDGAARAGSHAMLAMSETWSDLESFIKKSPDSAKATGLSGRLKAMSTLLSGATERIADREQKMLATTAKINELSKINESNVANEEESMKRQMILGSLNNSVNNLITSADFSKVRSQLAFSHFGEIEKEMEAKGVKAGDVKEQYKKNSTALASQYNNTPFGVYVNGQIAKAMGSVCDVVNNQCKEGTNASLFDFLDDSSRMNLKIIDKGSVVTPKVESSKIGPK
jgi:hypothetical protein